MRPFPSLEQGSAAVASGFPAGTEAAFTFWNVLKSVMQGAWVEILIIPVLALCVLLLQSKRTSVGSKTPKVSRSTAESPNKRNTASASSNKDDESQRVQKFVINLLHKTNKINPSAVLGQYEDLVKVSGNNLRRHIPDDQNARTMYVALVNCAASVSWDETADLGAYVQQWISRVLKDMRSIGIPRSIEFYASVLKILMNAQLPAESLRLHSAMLADGLVPNSAMYIGFLNAAVVAGESEKAISFFEEIATTSSPSLRTIMTLLRVHSTAKDWKSATKLLDRMESLGTPPDNLILNNVLGLCVSVGEVDGAEQLLQRWEHLADVISCNILLKGCTQQGNMARAEALLARMASKGPAPNLISYNTVMDCAVRAMQMLSDCTVHGNEGAGRNTADKASSLSTHSVSRRPWELLDQLLARDLEPDRYTCSTLVKGMHLAGSSKADIDRAVQLLQSIGPDALNAPSNSSNSASVGAGSNARLLEVLFNTLLDACITVRDLDKMTQIFGMMQDFNVSVSAVTYGTLIKAFGQAGRVIRCHEIWDDMQTAKIRPTIVTYGCYIDSCIRNDDYDRAEEVFESMASGPNGVRPNAVIYTSLIRGCAHAKKPSKALELYRRMQEDGIEATSVTFNSVLDIVARQVAKPAVLQTVIDDMCKASIAPDVTTYSILLKASCNSGNITTALSLFKQIQSRGLVFDQVAFNTLLLACSKADQVADAEDIFEEMRRCGVPPSHVTTSIMVKMYGKAKMLDKAVAVIELLDSEYGQKPNLYVYTCLIQACVQNKHVRRSWEVFNRMVTSGVEPDAVTYGTVIHGCIYLNKFHYAMSLVRHAYQRPQSSNADPTIPFLTAVPLKQKVPLQQEVLQALSVALQRKDQDDLYKELQGIMADSVAASKEPRSQARSTRRARPTVA